MVKVWWFFEELFASMPLENIGDNLPQEEPSSSSVMNRLEDGVDTGTRFTWGFPGAGFFVKRGVQSLLLGDTSSVCREPILCGILMDA